jgi:hypothetical protein
MSEKMALAAALEDYSLEEAIEIISCETMAKEGDAILANQIRSYKTLGETIRKAVDASLD